MIDGNVVAREFRKEKNKQVVMRKSNNMKLPNLNVPFKWIHPLYLSFASDVNVSLLFSLVSDSSYLLIEFDGNIPLALSPFFNMSNEAGLQKPGQHWKTAICMIISLANFHFCSQFIPHSWF